MTGKLHLFPVKLIASRPTGHKKGNHLIAGNVLPILFLHADTLMVIHLAAALMASAMVLAVMPAVGILEPSTGSDLHIFNGPFQ